MPDLPTISVTSAQATRINAAYGSVENYQKWLRSAVRDFVMRKEITDMITAAEAQQETRRQEILQALPDDPA